MSIELYIQAFLLILCCSIGISNKASGQFKYERESNIKEAKAPIAARELVNALPLLNRIKWFKEENLEGISYEAKTWHDDHYFSIEFDSLGVLEDIEEIIEWEEIPVNIAEKIHSTMANELSNFHIDKIQVQYTGALADLSKIFTEKTINSSVQLAYEIEVRGKLSDKYTLMEYLFAQNGDLIRRAEIIPRNTDNLEY
jgi:hypothetical protein